MKYSSRSIDDQRWRPPSRPVEIKNDAQSKIDRFKRWWDGFNKDLINKKSLNEQEYYYLVGMVSTIFSPELFIDDNIPESFKVEYRDVKCKCSDCRGRGWVEKGFIFERLVRCQNCWGNGYTNQTLMHTRDYVDKDGD